MAYDKWNILDSQKFLSIMKTWVSASFWLSVYVFSQFKNTPVRSKCLDYHVLSILNIFFNLLTILQYEDFSSKYLCIEECHLIYLKHIKLFLPKAFHSLHKITSCNMLKLFSAHELGCHLFTECIKRWPAKLTCKK